MAPPSHGDVAQCDEETRTEEGDRRANQTVQLAIPADQQEPDAHRQEHGRPDKRENQLNEDLFGFNDKFLFNSK